MTWFKATNIVTENMLVIFAMPKWILSLPFLPTRWTNAGLAMKELRRYMEERLEGEQGHLIEGLPGSGNLLSSLVRGSEQAKMSPLSATEPSLLEPQGLSKADILGDIFAFSLAGHETIGNVLTFATYLLAAHPEVQTWVQEEVDLVHAQEGACSRLEYKVFPKLKRCLAIMVRPAPPLRFSRQKSYGVLLTMDARWRL